MVFVPLSDDNPLRAIRFQWVTIGLIVANAAVFLLAEHAGRAGGYRQLCRSSRRSCSRCTSSAAGARALRSIAAVPEGLTLVTYQFLHGDILHLLSNMLFLWVFGDNVEDAMGHVKFLVFYLRAASSAAWRTPALLPNSTLPLIGASGAVAGVIAAYLILHPRVRVWVLAFRFIPLRIPAAWVLGVWVVTQFVMVAIAPSDQVAWWAHVGGMVAGAILILFMRRPGVPLFDRGLQRRKFDDRFAARRQCAGAA